MALITKLAWLALPVLVGCSTGGLQAGTGTTPQAKPTTIVQAAQSKRAAAEQHLGAPLAVEKSSWPIRSSRGTRSVGNVKYFDIKLETCRYSAAAPATEIKVEWVNNEGEWVVGNVAVTFAKGTSWEEAVKFIGSDPKNLKTVPQRDLNGYFKLEPALVKGWNFFFSADMARASSNGILMNEEGDGLPQIVIDSGVVESLRKKYED